MNSWKSIILIVVLFTVFVGVSLYVWGVTSSNAAEQNLYATMTQYAEGISGGR